MGERNIFNEKPVSFFKDHLAFGVGRYLLVILFINWINKGGEWNSANTSVLAWSMLILLVPIYQILFQRRDEIYAVAIGESGQVIVKWKKWWFFKEITIDTKNYIKSSVEPYINRCLRFSILVQMGNKPMTIHQLCSKKWTESKMKYVKTELDKLQR